MNCHFILYLNVLILLQRRCSGFAFIQYVCVCFCLHSCFTQDYDCNEVEGKHRAFPYPVFLPNTADCQPYNYTIAISFRSTLSSLMCLICLQSLSIALKTGHANSDGPYVLQKCGVNTQAKHFLLSDRAYPWMWNSSSPTPHLIAGPHAQLHVDLPHPRPYHFTYITVDQARISLMEPVPSCPPAEITPVSSRSTGGTGSPD